MNFEAVDLLVVECDALDDCPRVEQPSPTSAKARISCGRVTKRILWHLS